MFDILRRLREKLSGIFAIREIDRLESSEVSRMARDLGMSSEDLRTLDASTCRDAAALPRRLNALGLRRKILETENRAVLRDMQRVCSFCESKGVCQGDLDNRPDDPRWEQYCPNAATIHELGKEND
jgi:hypothetical protein